MLLVDQSLAAAGIDHPQLGQSGVDLGALGFQLGDGLVGFLDDVAQLLNAAFAALLTELGVTKDALLANKPLLTAVLTYHVIAAKVPAASVPVGKAITTVQGGVFKIETAGGLKITDGRNRVVAAPRAMAA